MAASSCFILLCFLLNNFSGFLYLYILFSVIKEMSGFSYTHAVIQVAILSLGLVYQLNDNRQEWRREQFLVCMIKYVALGPDVIFQRKCKCRL